MSDAPERWLDEASGSSERVRELLAVARPTPEMPASVRAASTAKVAELATKTTFGAAKVGLTLLALAAVGALLLQQDAERPVHSVSDEARAQAEPEAEAEAQAEPEPELEVEVEVELEPELERAVEPEVDETEPAVAPTPSPRQTSRAVPTEVAAEDTADPVEATEEDTLAAEVALIERGRATIANAPADALAAAHEHLRTFPHGQLSAAAQLIAIDALMRLGRRGEAIAHARAMTQRFPGSIYRQRLERLVGEDALRDVAPE